jgi:hypothetical protein
MNLRGGVLLLRTFRNAGQRGAAPVLGHRRGRSKGYLVSSVAFGGEQPADSRENVVYRSTQDVLVIG